MAKKGWINSNPNFIQGTYEQLSTLYKKAKCMADEAEEDPKHFLLSKPTGSGQTAKLIDVSTLLTPKVGKYQHQRHHQNAHKLLDSLSTTIVDLYIAQHYKADYIAYKRLARRVNENYTRIRTLTDNLLIFVDFSNQEAKLRHLERVVKIAHELYHNYSSSLDQEYRCAQADLHACLTSEDFAYLHYVYTLGQCDNIFIFFLKEIRYALRQVVRILIRNRKRDVRTRLREVIRFHFKNMDDEADATEIFHCSSKNFISSKFYNSWILNNQFKSSITY